MALQIKSWIVLISIPRGKMSMLHIFGGFDRPIGAWEARWMYSGRHEHLGCSTPRHLVCRKERGSVFSRRLFSPLSLLRRSKHCSGITYRFLIYLRATELDANLPKGNAETAPGGKKDVGNRFSYLAKGVLCPGRQIVSARPYPCEESYSAAIHCRRRRSRDPASVRGSMYVLYTREIPAVNWEARGSSLSRRRIDRNKISQRRRPWKELQIRSDPLTCSA